MEDYNKKMEENLLEMIRQKQATDKRLLWAQTIIQIIFWLIVLSAYIFISPEIDMQWKFGVYLFINVAGMLSILFCLKMEQLTGYYQCKHCKHTYIPTYGAVFNAIYFGWSKYLRCPKCGKRSWHKKVFNKD